ncbi:MAG TPA: DUF2892 domain-containing protein [Chloroflexi bacterium]|jgi:uncharacterized membrane protein|nr:DUF2892 domain-containing protein [Chloroflexota bacterium]
MNESKTASRVNIGPVERWLSLITGAALFFYWMRRSYRNFLWLAGSGLLVYRGLTGHSYLYTLMGRRREMMPRLAPRRGLYIHDTITINRPVDDVYYNWRNLRNLPRIMSHLQSVTPEEDGRSHWVVRAPGPIPVTMEWDAEIVEERENELLRWQSRPGSDVDAYGELRFREAPGGRGTELELELSYDPPGGVVTTSTFGKMFNKATEYQIMEDLRSFKRVLETGEVPTTEGQPSGRL